MSNCNELIESIYVHPDINNLISKIQPESIRDDLRQEIAVSLLEQPCEKIAALFAEDNLLKYAIKTCWLMATSKNSNFYYKYRKKDLVKAVEYMRLNQTLPTIPLSFADAAKKELNSRTETIYDDHEVRIFNKYVELGSGRAVARFYNIPVNHVCTIIQKVKTELKCLLLR